MNLPDEVTEASGRPRTTVCRPGKGLGADARRPPQSEPYTWWRLHGAYEKETA
jgi:hypothetical protein